MERASPLMLPRIDRSRSPSPMRDPRALYFAYGSNAHHAFMKSICPSAQVLGIARLKHWRWQLNAAGYSNIVEAPAAPYSPGTARWLGPLGGDLREDKDRVYGVVYRLEKEDEATLEKEMGRGGGRGYTKEIQTVDFWGRWQDGDGEWRPADLRNGRIQRIKIIVYADRKDTKDGGVPSAAYLTKLHAAIKDAMAQGVPKSYFEEFVRPYLPEMAEEKALSLAIQDALKKGVDVRRLVEKAEAEFEAKEADTNGTPQASL